MSNRPYAPIPNSTICGKTLRGGRSWTHGGLKHDLVASQRGGFMDAVKAVIDVNAEPYELPDDEPISRVEVERAAVARILTRKDTKRAMGKHGARRACLGRAGVSGGSPARSARLKKRRTSSPACPQTSARATTRASFSSRMTESSDFGSVKKKFEPGPPN